VDKDSLRALAADAAAPPEGAATAS
jgi:hypothetical protein